MVFFAEMVLDIFRYKDFFRPGIFLPQLLHNDKSHWPVNPKRPSKFLNIGPYFIPALSEKTFLFLIGVRCIGAKNFGFLGRKSIFSRNER